MFLGDIATNWSVKTDQSATDLSDFRKSDLQAAVMDLSGTTLSATMKHKMGLAIITLKQKTIPGTITDSNGGSLTAVGSTTVTRTTSGTYTVTATNAFYGNTPLLYGTRTYYGIVKASTNTTFNSSASEKDAWASPITANITAGQFNNYYADSQRDFYTSYTGTFYYCGTSLSIVIPSKATYTLQAWGAKGGYYNLNGTDIGGNGGDSKGEISLAKGTNLYICCGGRRTGGESVTNAYADQYNGGGGDQDPGGGATHIATGTTNRGELKNYESYKNEVLVVGGGGGGADSQDGGGTGGGENGGNSVKGYGKGGTQTGGGNGVYPGSFGKGGTNPNHGSGGGGGGWYGGGSSTNAGDYGGGGGSGYVNTSGGVTFISWNNGSCAGYGHASVTASY